MGQWHAPGAGCRIELELPRLIDAIHEACDDGAGPDVAEVCVRCDLVHGDTSLCPGDDLSAGLVRAVEWVEERRRQWECVRNWVAHQPGREKAPVRKMIEAYEEATAMLIGCD